MPSAKSAACAGVTSTPGASMKIVTSVVFLILEAAAPPAFSQSKEARSADLPRPITKIRSAADPSGATISRAVASLAVNPAILAAFATTPDGSAALTPAAVSASLVLSRMA
jgi:hypothetical protein